MTKSPAPKRPARSRRPAAGRKSSLSKERICVAALELIDAGGLERFSMRDVARTLGVYPTAIYWYVPGRNALLAEVVGYALRDVTPPARSTDWKAWLRELFRRYRKAVRRHPHIAPLVGASLLSGGGIRTDLIERLLEVLVKAGFDDKHLVEAYNVVLAAKVGFVTVEFAALPTEQPSAWAADYQKRLRTIDALAYPMLARHLPALANRSFCLRWCNGTEVPLDTSFELFVDAVILGLEQTLKQQRRKAGGGRRRAS